MTMMGRTITMISFNRYLIVAGSVCINMRNIELVKIVGDDIKVQLTSGNVVTIAGDGTETTEVFNEIMDRINEVNVF